MKILNQLLTYNLTQSMLTYIYMVTKRLLYCVHSFVFRPRINSPFALVMMVVSSKHLKSLVGHFLRLIASKLSLIIPILSFLDPNVDHFAYLEFLHCFVLLELHAQIINGKTFRPFMNNKAAV